jgi:hypothetical protein
MDNQLKDVVVPYGEYADEFSVGVHSAHHSLTYKWHIPGNFLNKKYNYDIIYSAVEPEP